MVAVKETHFAADMSRIADKVFVNFRDSVTKFLSWYTEITKLCFRHKKLLRYGLIILRFH